VKSCLKINNFLKKFYFVLYIMVRVYTLVMLTSMAIAVLAWSDRLTDDTQRTRLDLGYTLLPVGKLDASSSYSTVIFRIKHLPPSNFTRTLSFCDKSFTQLYGYSTEYGTNDRQQGLLSTASRQYAQLCAGYDALQQSFDRLSSTIFDETEDLQEDIDLLAPRPQRTATDRQGRRGPRSFGDNVRKFFGIASHDVQSRLVDRVTNLQRRQDFLTDKLHNLTMITDLQTDVLDDLLTASDLHTDVLNNHTRRLTEIFIELHRNSLENAVDHALTMRLHTLTRQITVTGMLQLQTLQHLLTLNTQRIVAVNTLLSNKVSPLLIPPTDLQNALKRVRSQLHLHYPSYSIVHTDVAYYYANQQVVAWTSHADIYVSLKVPLTSVQEEYELYEIVTFPLQSADSNINTILANTADIIGYNAYHHSLVKMSWNDYDRYCTKSGFTTCINVLPQYKHAPATLCESALYEQNIQAIIETCNFKAVISDTSRQTVSLVNTGYRRILIITAAPLQAYIQCRAAKTRHQKMIGPTTEIILNCDCSLNSDLFTIPPLLTDDCANLKLDYNITQVNTTNMLLKALYYNVSNIDELSELPSPRLNTSTGYIIAQSQTSSGKILDLKNLITATKANVSMTPYAPIWFTKSHSFLSTGISMIWKFIIPILAILSTVSVIIICIATKTKMLSKTVALLSTVAPSTARPMDTGLSAPVWVEHVILAILIFIATTIIMVKLYKYVAKKLTGSFIQLLDYKLSPRFTKIYLAVFNARQTEYVLIETICQTMEHLQIPRRVGSVRLSLIRHWFSATLNIQWDDFVIDCDNQELTWRMPTVVPISLFQHHRLARVISNCHNCRILIGSDDIYQSHKIMIKEHKLLNMKQTLPGTGETRRQSM